MKQIESKPKTHSNTWLTPVLLIFIAFFAMAMVSPVNAAPPSQCGTVFCDQDGDRYIREHKKCPDFCPDYPDRLGQDCDDNDVKLTTECNGGSSGGYIQHNLPNRVIWGNGSDLEFPFETDYFLFSHHASAAAVTNHRPSPIRKATWLMFATRMQSFYSEGSIGTPSTWT